MVPLGTDSQGRQVNLFNMGEYLEKKVRSINAYNMYRN